MSSYDEWKQRTPEEDRAIRASIRRHGRPRDPDDEPDAMQCQYCGQEKNVEDMASKTECRDCYMQDRGDPGPPEIEEDEPDHADATPVLEGDDPDEYIDDFSPLFRDEPPEGGC